MVAGKTASANFPVTANALQSTFSGAPQPVGPNVYGDAFVSRLNAAGSNLLYSTYLGGSGDDYANSVAIDSAGNIYLAGVTSSSNYPVTRGAYETTLPSAGSPVAGGFVSKISPAGSFAYSTYMAISGAIDVDRSGFVYMFSGGSTSAIPYLSPAVTILNQAGSAIVSSGGSGVALSGSSPMVIDGNGYVYQTGQVGAGEQPFFTTPGAA